MSVNADAVDDDLLPEQSRFDWFYVALASAALQTLIALPMQLGVYLAGWSREAIVATLTAWVYATPAPWGVILVLGLIMAAGLVGPVVALYYHDRDLDARGVDVSTRWLLLALLGTQSFVLTLGAVAGHYHARTQAGDRA